MKYKLRCSSLDKLAFCSHSVTYPKPEYKIPTNEKAKEGTIIHKKAENNIVDDDTNFI